MILIEVGVFLLLLLQLSFFPSTPVNASLFLSPHPTPSLIINKALDDFPWYNDSLPLSTRLSSLIAAMTLKEKITQMRSTTPSIPRLRVPAYSYYSEAGHGVADTTGRVSVFPMPLAQAATFDKEFMSAMGAIIANESRVLYNEYTAAHQNDTTTMYGVNELVPVGNIFTHSQWGRGQESYGEDPYLIKAMIIPLIRSMQQIDINPETSYYAVGCTCKHFFGYAFDGDIPVGGSDNEYREHTHANLTYADIMQTFTIAFHSCVKDANVLSIMLGNLDLRVVGEEKEYPMIVSPLIHGRLKEWNFTGYAIADADRLEHVLTKFNYTQNYTTLAALGLNTGVDLETGTVYLNHLEDAINANYTTESLLDQSLTRSFKSRFLLGLFDPKDKVPYNQLNRSIIDIPSSRALAKQGALESFVLLKNDGGLPIDWSSSNINSIAIVGPNANRTTVLLGLNIADNLFRNYAGCADVNDCILITPYMGIESLLTQRINPARSSLSLPPITLTYNRGVDTNSTDKSDMQNAINNILKADLVIACMGLDTSIEAEARDRPNLYWPGLQEPFLDAVINTGTPAILLLLNAGPIYINKQVLSPLILSIMELWYGGEETGTAVADILFGYSSPSGRLPIQFPLDDSQLPYYLTVNMTESPGRSYRYSKVIPLYSFGFGLSYNDYKYDYSVNNKNQLLSTNRWNKCNDYDFQDCLDQTVDIIFTVENTGIMTGDEIAEVYVTYLPFNQSTVSTNQSIPRTELKEFTSIKNISIGEMREIKVTLTAIDLRLVGPDNIYTLLPGVYYIYVGGAAPGSRGIAVDGEINHESKLEINITDRICANDMDIWLKSGNGEWIEEMNRAIVVSPLGIERGLLGLLNVC